MSVAPLWGRLASKEEVYEVLRQADWSDFLTSFKAPPGTELVSRITGASSCQLAPLSHARTHSYRREPTALLGELYRRLLALPSARYVTPPLTQ